MVTPFTDVESKAQRDWLSQVIQPGPDIDWGSVIP